MTETEKAEPIVIPPRLSYVESRQLAAEHFSRSLGAVTTTFDWSETRFATLPEIVSILNWSARLRKLQKRVVWVFTDPARSGESETERFAAALREPDGVVDTIEARLEEIRAQLRARQLFRGTRLTMLDELRKKLTTQTGRDWFDAIARRLAAADVLGYLDRYKVLHRATELEIIVTPDHHSVGLSKMRSASETATISMRSIHSIIDVDTTVKELNDAETVATILGKYANLDVVRRGGLANVLVRELGNNVDDHAEASAAWLCSRGVKRDEIDPHDPVTKPFLTGRSGYFELIVCDDGVGLTSALKDVLLSDTREMTRKRYSGARSGMPETKELIDYAFDRLSSNSRRHELLADDKVEAEGVASGLYWIWNLVRGRRGVISVRTAGQCAWYDLMQPQDDDDAPLPAVEAFACEGTFIRVCFPVDEPKVVPRGRAKPIGKPWKFHHVAVGDLSRVTASLPLAREGTGEPPLTQNQDRLLTKLHKRRDEIASGDILILDVTGMRRQWDKTTAMPLSNFFVKTNYTSAAGRAAAVLWNVPQHSIEVFEQAIESVGRFRKTKDISRFALMVSEQSELRIFCGWREAEEMFSLFTRDAEELTLEQLGIAELSADDAARFVAGVRENTHIFEFEERPGAWNQSVVKLRPWTALLRAQVWRSNASWFAEALDKPLDSGGVLVRRSAGEGYYRLPSTDLLSRDFYHFRGFFSDQQAFARITWMMFQVLWRSLEKVPPDYIVAVSRPAAALARSVADTFVSAGHARPELLVADHVEHLRVRQRDVQLAGKRAVLIMTAISTGKQVAQLEAVFASQQMQWLGTFVCLDARGLPADSLRPLDLDMEVEVTEGVFTGPVYCLARRAVEKIPYDGAGDEPIISIDPVNVCPVQLPPAEDGGTEETIFAFIKDEEVLRLGHLDSDQYHHYLYYVDLKRLLQQPEGLLDRMVRDIVSSLPADYDADRTVLLYPPATVSSAELIASEAQQYIGARYELALYRDTFAGEWRFSPFALHGLPLDNATVIIIDDGSNTGETLLGLLHAATIGSPQRIRAYLGLHRLPPQKIRLFRSLRGMAECSDVRVLIAARLAIPVYSPRDCPVCRLRRDVEHIVDKAVLLHSIAKETLDLLHATRTSGEQKQFLWRYSDKIPAAKIREDLEICEYDAAADKRLDQRLRAVTNGAGCSALLDLAFVVCAEPELIRSRAIARHAARLLLIVAEAIAACPGRSEAATLACFAYYVTTRSDTRVEPQEAEVIGTVYQALLARPDASPRLVGQVVCVMAADAVSSDITITRPETPLAWLQRFVDASDTGKVNLTATFGALYAREALSILKGEPIFSHVPETRRNDDLIELITAVASKLYRHSAKASESHVSKLLAATRSAVQWRPEQLSAHVQALLVTIDQFEELRARLFDADRASLQTKRETLDVLIDWHTPQIESSVREIANNLRKIAELLLRTDPNPEERFRARRAAAAVASEFERLTRATDLAFDGLFPRPFRIIDLELEKFERKTPIIVKRELSIASVESVYFPSTLLERFIDAAFGNLTTAAFYGLPPDRLKRAEVRVVLREVVEGARPREIMVEVIDNGPSFSESERTAVDVKAEPRGNRALDDLTGLAPTFFGHIKKERTAEWFRVWLTMRAYKRPELSSLEGAAQ